MISARRLEEMRDTELSIAKRKADCCPAVGLLAREYAEALSELIERRRLEEELALTVEEIGLDQHKVSAAVNLYLPRIASNA